MGMAAQRREVKLSFRELHVSCPHCHAALTIGTVMDTILMSLRTCPKCGKEFVIENDVPRKTGRPNEKAERIRQSCPCREAQVPVLALLV
jgi:transposase-like protein